MTSRQEIWKKFREWEKEVDPTPESPYAFLQWKGTDACIDLYCSECGHHAHLDVEFLYSYKCQCGQIYHMSPYIRMIKAADDEVVANYIAENAKVEDPWA